ncbi:caspase-7-like [Watersipora subatra]|uniref:caspase-7-like n=1 Tax=Watersipora subatra TaxID=2589382 RepID=UPI00355C2039
MDITVPDARAPGFSKASAAPPPPASYAAESYSTLEDEDFEYHMRHKSRGIAIIINNEKFAPETKMSARSGSDVDRNNLEEALKYVGFKEIHVYDNLTSNKMLSLMTEASQVNYRDRDCVFVAILSHGEEGMVYGTDKPVSYDNLFEPFKNSESLVGKPKIFVMQACRGDELDRGARYQADALPPKEQRVPPKEYFISKESDFLLAYSVVPGYYSWRNCANGSWFIQAFCEVMKRDGRRLELVQMLTRVNRMVSYTFKSNASSEHMTNKKQSPCITSMLTKALYFA